MILALKWLPPLTWMAFLFFLSSQPGTGRPAPFPHADKVAHFVLYAILGALVATSLQFSRRTSSPNRLLFQGSLITFLYGVSDEFHQTFVPGRSADVLDLLADGVGGVFGVLIALRGISILSGIRKQEGDSPT